MSDAFKEAMASFSELKKTALAIKAERDALLAVARAAKRYQDARHEFWNGAGPRGDDESRWAEEDMVAAEKKLTAALAALPAGWDR